MLTSLIDATDNTELPAEINELRRTAFNSLNAEGQGKFESCLEYHLQLIYDVRGHKAGVHEQLWAWIRAAEGVWRTGVKMVTLEDLEVLQDCYRRTPDR